MACHKQEPDGKRKYNEENALNPSSILLLWKGLNLGPVLKSSSREPKAVCNVIEGLQENSKREKSYY